MRNNERAFLALLRAGLWEKDVQLIRFGNIDFSAISNLADQQAVLGLLAAGIEHVTDLKVPKDIILQIVGLALQLEQRNKEMDLFIASLINEMRDQDIYSLLVKGQGVAQCYERPLWRACGDVDFYLSENNYKNAKALLGARASHVDIEDKKKKASGDDHR